MDRPRAFPSDLRYNLRGLRHTFQSLRASVARTSLGSRQSPRPPERFPPSTVCLQGVLGGGFCVPPLAWGIAFRKRMRYPRLAKGKPLLPAPTVPRHPSFYKGTRRPCRFLAPGSPLSRGSGGPGAGRGGRSRCGSKLFSTSNLIALCQNSN